MEFWAFSASAPAAAAAAAAAMEIAREPMLSQPP
jgi:hypothetical protein